MESEQFDPETALNEVSPQEREHYHELMRHDPIAGAVFLRALSFAREARDD
jgi:hypothetical protein